MQGHPKPRPRRRATTQTIEEIEARAAEILQAERDVLADLAEWLRAAAVELPVESKLPIRMAKAANNADLFTRGDLAEFGVRDTEKLIDEWNRERCEMMFDALAKVLGRTVS